MRRAIYIGLPRRHLPVQTDGEAVVKSIKKPEKKGD